ncbi:MAG: hypothetical protein Q7S26_02945 [bacterium]|nr:hypothetical protein [bacterium]
MEQFYLERKLSTPKKRALFILGLPFLLTILLFLFICLVSISKNLISPTGNLSAHALDKQSDFNFDDFISQFSQTFKMPLYFLNFDLYTINNIYVRDVAGNRIATALNFDINGLYTGGIKNGELRRIYGEINATKLTNLQLPISRSVDIYPSKAIGATSTLVLENNSNYLLFILPSWWSFLLFWILSILFLYGLIVLFSLCLRFILIGSPMLDVFDKYHTKTEK